MKAAAITAVLATAVAVAPHAIAGPTVIGVDGTTVHAVHLPSSILGDVLDYDHGAYRQLSGYTVVHDEYDRSFGLLTLGGPGYDKSVAGGVEQGIALIKTAQGNDHTTDVKLVCLSQGSDVCSQMNDQLKAAGYDQSHVSYVLLGNVDNVEGLKARIPKIGQNGIFIPGPGVTIGDTNPTSGSDATITQVSFEYDGFARAPEYPINVIADLNAMVGTALEHGNYRNADPNAPGNIVSTTPDGRITNIMIPVKEVPLVTVARMMGLPQPVADLINPPLKAIIDTGYGPVPNGPGAYPTQAQPFKVLPSATELQTDVKNVEQGFADSLKQATPTAPSVPKSKLSSPMKTGNLSKPTLLAGGGNSNPTRQTVNALSTVQKSVNKVVQGTVSSVVKALTGQKTQHGTGAASSSGDNP